MSAPDWLRPLLDAVRDDDVLQLLPPELKPPADARRSAVLVLFGEGPHGPDVLLIERTAHLRSHAGQPAFPGGGIDPDDDGPVAAALREAEEETGLDPSGVDVLTALPELWLPPSGNVVTPVLAWWRTPSDVTPADVHEVASVARWTPTTTARWPRRCARPSRRPACPTGGSSLRSRSPSTGTRRPAASGTTSTSATC